jgi:hypothetical protein
MAENTENKKKSGLLSLYLNESISNPEFPRLLSWVGKIEKELGEWVVETCFISAIKEKVPSPFSIKNFPLNRNKESYIESKIRLSIAPFLRAGTLWKSGAEMSDHNHLQFKKLVVKIENPLSSNPIKFYTTSSFKTFRREYPFPNKAAASSFVISFNDLAAASEQSKFDKMVHNLVIPCFELARFYFFNSSTATRAVLTPGSLDPTSNKFFKPDDSIHPVSGSGMLECPRIIFRIPTKNDRLVSARIAFSSEARRAVSMIQKSILDGGSFGYIMSTFPFSTPTDLEVLGVEVLDPVTSTRLFLVLEILSCTGQFPFAGLEYSYDWTITEPKKGPPPTNSEPKDKNDNPKDGKKPGEPDIDNNDPPPPKNTSPTYLGGKLHIGRLAGARFKSAPAENNLRYFKAEVETGGDKNPPPRNYKPKGYSEKENIGGKGTVPKLETQTIDDPDLLTINQKRFQRFNDICNGIAQDEKMEVTFITDKFSEETVSFYPISNAPYRYFTWCYRDVDRAIPREYSLAEVCYLGESFFYIMEHSERSKDEKIGMWVIRKRSKNEVSGDGSKFYDEITLAEWDAILTSIGKNHGKLAALKTKYEIFSLYHTQETSIEKIIPKIMKRVNLQ